MKAYPFRSQKGYALLAISSLLAILSIMTFTVMARFDSVNSLQKGAASRTEAFYIVEGIRAIAQNLTQKYLTTSTAPTLPGLKIALDTQLPPYVPNGYSVAPVLVTGDLSPLDPSVGSANPIPVGPFAGMPALQADMILKLKIFSESSFISSLATSHPPVGEVDLQVHLSKLSPFQFAQFWDQPFRDIAGAGVAPGQLTINGRIHSNGDVCVGNAGGGGATTAYTGLTIAGRAMVSGDARCKYDYVPPGFFTNFLTISDANGTPVNPLNRTWNSSGCKNCSNSGQAWPIYAFSRYKGNVYDYFQGVPQLKYPEAFEAQTQPGLDGDPNSASDNASTNSGNMRFLIDPVLPTDSQAVQDKKFANSADIRIINGVWYLKGTWTQSVSPSNYLATLNAWPGIPIWSDHPGRAQDDWGKKVGQDDIRDLWATTSWPWASNLPSLYSPYGFDSATQSLTTSMAGAITYGGTVASHLSETQADDPNDPNIGTNAVEVGILANKNCSGGRCRPPGVLFHPWCPATVGSPYVSSFTLPLQGASYLPIPYNTTTIDWVKANYPITCVYCKLPFDTACQAKTAHIKINTLLAARIGIRDRNFLTQSASDGNQSARANILPTNFSVKDFALALAATGAGELGSYFGAGKFHPNAFNGIVYITNTWPGSNLGFGSATPPPELLTWPLQGSAVDINQPAIAGAFEQRALPYALCSNSSTAARPGFAGQGFVNETLPNGTPTVKFRIPDCAQYGTGAGQIPAYSNGILVTNAYDLSSFASTGLSIVSNIPVYLNSGINTRGTWIPTLVAGDTVTLRVDCVRAGSFDSNYECGYPGYRFWNAAVLGGWSATNTSTKSSFAPGVGNNWAQWQGSNLMFKGSVTMGFNPVYYRSNRESFGTAPNTFAADSRFNDPTRVPPGMPFFTVFSLSQWQRK